MPRWAERCSTRKSLDWTAISPAIFVGALFQSVMEPAERRAQGAHHMTEENILKVIEPLFLDDLRAEFRRMQTRRDGAPATACLLRCTRRVRPRLGLRLDSGQDGSIDGGSGQRLQSNPCLESDPRP